MAQVVLSCQRCSCILAEFEADACSLMLPRASDDGSFWRLLTEAEISETTAVLEEVVGERDMVSSGLFRCRSCSSRLTPDNDRTPWHVERSELGKPPAFLKSGRAADCKWRSTWIGLHCSLQFKPSLPPPIMAPDVFLSQWCGRAADYLIDLRERSCFNHVHLRGSTSLPWSLLEVTVSQLPIRDTPVMLLIPADLVGPVLLWMWSRRRCVCSVVADSEGLWQLAAEKIDSAGLSLVGSVATGSRSRRSWDPSPLIASQSSMLLKLLQQDNAQQLPFVALDIGCGSGRDAVFLAIDGWDVTAVDEQPKALNRLKLLASADCVPVKTLAANVESAAGFCELQQLPKADLIIFVRYLHRPLLSWAKNHLNDGGFFLMSHFLRGAESIGRCFPKTPEHLLERGELREFFTDFEILLDEETSLVEDGRPVANFLARKRRQETDCAMGTSANH